jgi:hypothetical protein
MKRQGQGCEEEGLVVDENAEVKVNDIMLVNNNFVTFKKETDAESCWSKHKVIATIYPYKIQGIQMIGDPKPAQISEEDLRKAMLYASYKTLNNKSIISHRNIDEYIQSINPLPTSAIFTDDGEFINFKY